VTAQGGAGSTDGIIAVAQLEHGGNRRPGPWHSAVEDRGLFRWSVPSLHRQTGLGPSPRPPWRKVSPSDPTRAAPPLHAHWQYDGTVSATPLGAVPDPSEDEQVLRRASFPLTDSQPTLPFVVFSDETPGLDGHALVMREGVEYFARSGELRRESAEYAPLGVDSPTLRQIFGLPPEEVVLSYVDFLDEDVCSRCGAGGTPVPCNLAFPFGINTLRAVRRPMWPRQRAAVMLSPWCSGFMVTDVDLLTAAHCLYNFTFGTPRTFTHVATQGNLASRGAEAKLNIGITPGTSLSLKPAYLTEFTAKNDIAAVSLGTGWGESHHTWCISELSTADELEGLVVQQIGYPRFRLDRHGGCIFTDESPMDYVDGIFGISTEPKEQTGSISEVVAGRQQVKSVNMTNAGGTSGSAIFHCGLCERGDDTFAVGVTHGFGVGRPEAIRYSKVASHRAWIQGQTRLAAGASCF
jgi:hypothetical protein